METKEEGEISDSADDSFGVLYQPVSRPDPSLYRPVSQHVPSSDEDYTSDSDSDAPLAPKRRRPNVTKMETCTSESTGNAPKEWMDNRTEGRSPALKAKRRNTVWSTVMEEQVLSQEIGGFGLKRRLDQGDRSVESYDYMQALELRGIKPRREEEEEETEEGKNKRMSRKRHMRGRPGYHNPKTHCGRRELLNVEDNEELTDSELGYQLAEGLMERKPELIVRVVEVLGRAKALQVYRQTQEVERDGGLMIKNGSRRRTSGGVYLQLIKSWPGVGKEELARIFPQEDEGRHQQWGKREKAHRKRERHESKPQGESVSEEGPDLGDLFSDDPGGTKCPGSTPVTTPQHSDNEAEEVAAPLINQLSPSGLPELIVPSSLSPPPSLKKDSPDDQPQKLPQAPTQTSPAPNTYNGGFLEIGAVDPRARDQRTTDTYDEDFLEIHTNEEMELF